MDFEKYQHIERLRTIETRGILEGEVYVFPKIDGTNGSIWFDKELKAGSRNRVLNLEKDNQGFLNYILNNTEYNKKLIDFFNKYPSYRLYGEWLVPHTLKTYREDAWNKFYIFDVADETNNYLHYEIYSNILKEFDLEFIAPLCKIKMPKLDRIQDLVFHNTYLIKDGEGTGEGIVIKRYDFVNRFGRTTWGKVVKNEFKEKMDKNKTREVKEKKYVEEEIIDKFFTESFVEKEYSKIINDAGYWSSKLIPRLIETLFYTLIKEESWNILKQFKNPIIDFKILKALMIMRLKEIKSDLF